MAIQQRRGNIADLDISKLVQGEPFICLDKDSNGRFYAGIAVAPSQVMRLAEFNEMLDVLTDCEQARDDAEAAASSASTSEINAGNSADDAEAWAVGQINGVDVPNTDPRYENNSKYYADLSEDAWTNIDNAMQIVTPTLSIDFTTGIMSYTGSFFDFVLNQSTGHLEWGVAV